MRDPFNNPWDWQPMFSGQSQSSSGAPPMPAGGGTASMFGMGLAMAGAAMSAIGSYYDAVAKQGELQSQELAAEFQASMSVLNQRSAEREAARVEADGQQEMARMTLAAGAEKSAARAELSARGVETTEGSAAELLASMDWAKDVDKHTVTMNTFRAARASRERAVAFANERDAYALAARNASRSRRTINPLMAGIGSLIGSAGPIMRGNS